MIITSTGYFIDHVMEYISVAQAGEEVEIVLNNNESLVLKVKEED